MSQPTRKRAPKLPPSGHGSKRACTRTPPSSPKAVKYEGADADKVITEAKQNYRVLADTRFQVGNELQALRSQPPAEAAVKMHELMMQHVTDKSEVTKGIAWFIFSTLFNFLPQRIFCKRF